MGNYVRIAKPSRIYSLFFLSFICLLKNKYKDIVYILYIKIKGGKIDMKSKKTGVPTNMIINTRLERLKKAKNKRLRKMNNCQKCSYFKSSERWCQKYDFKISGIEVGTKCKSFNCKI